MSESRSTPTPLCDFLNEHDATAAKRWARCMRLGFTPDGDVRDQAHVNMIARAWLHHMGMLCE